MEINNSRPRVNGGIRINSGLVRNSNVRFLSNLPADCFETNSLDKYITEYKLQKAVNENSKIRAVLSEVNLPVELDMTILQELQNGHASDTKKIACGILDNLPFSLKTKADRSAVEKAAYLHDVGKALIPEEILNKKGKLNEEETIIMHKHPQLSFELLKNSGIDNKSLNIIKNHHQNDKKTGYPFVDNTFFADINLQVVSAADKYSALTEQRPYKQPMSSEGALTVIYKDVQDGKLNPLVFNALVKYAQTFAGSNYDKSFTNPLQ